MKKKRISLGVNIDHAATLRQVRGGTTSYPDLLQMTKIVHSAGAHQITIHLREDRRHIQDADVVHLCKKSKLPINLEMAVSPEMLKIALKNKPAWVCFVPEKREELTTEGGLNVLKVQKAGIRVSYFIEAHPEQVSAAALAGADAVEFHTGHWVLSTGSKKEKIWQSLIESALKAHQLKMRVHAGHGIDFEHAKIIRKLPHLKEVNIGHSLICYALESGLEAVTKRMLAKLK